jgi:hypothetical protein
MRIHQALKILESEFEQNRLNNGSLLNLQDTLISILRNVRLPKEKIDTKFQMVVEEKNKKEIIPRTKKRKLTPKRKIGKL